jgi:hypothetical protein
LAFVLGNAFVLSDFGCCCLSSDFGGVLQFGYVECETMGSGRSVFSFAAGFSGNYKAFFQIAQKKIRTEIILKKTKARLVRRAFFCLLKKGEKRLELFVRFR